MKAWRLLFLMGLNSLPQIRKLAQHLDIGVFFLEDPGEFCQQTQVFLSVMFLNALHIQEFLRTEGCLLVSRMVMDCYPGNRDEKGLPPGLPENIF